MPDEPVVQTPPALQPGPWEQDIRSSFTDPQTAAQVDNFLRARIQPRMTQLEQEIASAREAQRLVDSFQSDPVGTFEAVRNELVQAGYPVGQAAQIANDAAAAAAQAPQAPPAPSPSAPAAAATEDPRVAEMYGDWTRQRELEAYDAEVARIVNDPANADINPNRFHLYVAASEGDFNAAINLYRSDVAAVLQDYGVDPTTATAGQREQAAQIAAGQQGAPPTLGAGAGGAGSPVPTQPNYAAEGLSPQDALHRAIDDAATSTFSRNSAPPAIS